MTRRSIVAFPVLLISAIALQLVALPNAIAPARPLWVPMIFAYWTFISPAGPSILLAWLVGLTLDVLFNTPLGEHAVALLLMIWLVHWLRRFMLMVSFWQTTLVLAPAWAVYAGLTFWLDGSRGVRADAWMLWLPIASSVILWPFLFPVLSMLGKPSRD
jgi:rod shape-determining protein MreD